MFQGRELNLSVLPERRGQDVGTRPETQYATVDQLGGGITGEVEVDFGAHPGSNEASITFADVDIEASSLIRAWFDGGASTADHSEDDHRYAPVFINLTAKPTAGVGGTIYARSLHKMTGRWAISYSWS